MADSDWANELVGKTLANRYAVESVLGSGGMGVVLKATHLRLDRPVAIKMVHPMLSRDATIIARFHQEARAAASVGSAGVVEVIDLDEDPEHGPFLVMELLRGESFVDVLQRGRLEVERALWIVTELLDVLGAVHAKGIVHRDLKPPNVFLHQDEAGDEVVKVLDFGIAKVSQRHLTMTGQIVGTPRFMAPEQALGEDLDERCDLYAAGLLLYCALTGLPPYASVPNHKIIEAVNQGPPSLRTLRPDLPAALLELVDKSLASKPNDRFQDAGSMAGALRALGDGTSTPLESPHPPTSDPSESHPSGSHRSESAPSESHPSESHPSESHPPESHPSESAPSKSHSSESHRAGSYSTAAVTSKAAVTRRAGGEPDGSEGAATVESTRPPVFADGVSSTGRDQTHGNEQAPESGEIVVPERQGWKWAIGLLSLVALGTGGFLATQGLRGPSARVALEVEGSCLVPQGVVPVTNTSEGMQFGEGEGPRLVVKSAGNRYWIATGTSAQGASAEALSGTGPGRVRVRALELGEIDVTFTRVPLVSAGGPCIISGEIRSD